MNRCKWCEATGGLIEIEGYDWESDEDTALSAMRVVGYECSNATACARRAIEQGTNVTALRRIVADRENMPRALREQARELLSQWSDLARETARAAEAASREAGWGVIGGPNA